ncbi:hypothetical protein SESBI_32776 [Sesbania bispinosa]|nr:hypothetical protein SESBI_32776 [Sesbania bispinosa]
MASFEEEGAVTHDQCYYEYYLTSSLQNANRNKLPFKMQSSDFSWMVPIEVMLGSLNHGEVQACSISRVPDELHDPKKDAFKPKLVSIGPLHRGATRHLQLMEEPKWHYMSEFLDRRGTPEQTRRSEIRLRDCGIDILKLDKVIRASYGGNIESEPHDFTKIMIVDGCFLLELLIKLSNYMENQTGTGGGAYSHDPIFETEKKILSVLNDITMLENQIPFIVLKKLYRKWNRVNKKENVLNKSYCAAAARLRAAGIIIRSKQNSSVMDQHKLVDTFNFEICFKTLGSWKFRRCILRKRRRILIRDHIPTVWKFIGVVAAVLLLVLTVMQTYYSSRSSN